MNIRTVISINSAVFISRKINCLQKKELAYTFYTVGKTHLVQLKVSEAP